MFLAARRVQMKTSLSLTVLNAMYFMSGKIVSDYLQDATVNSKRQKRYERKILCTYFNVLSNGRLIFTMLFDIQFFKSSFSQLFKLPRW